VSRERIIENAVPVHPAIPSKNASVNPMCSPSINGIPLTIAQESQKRATEHIAIDSLTPRSVRGRVRNTVPRRKNVTGTAAIGRIISHSEKSMATIRGTAVNGAIKVNISPTSAIIVER
jgi:hypothetical protein